jgi:hypothetical protein
MPLIGFTDRLDSIEENLLYKAQDGSYWLSGVCTFHQDAKGCTIVVQSVSKERRRRRSIAQLLQLTLWIPHRPVF